MRKWSAWIALWYTWSVGGSGVCTGCSSHHEHDIDSVQSPPEVVVKLIGGLWCEGPGCQQNVQLQNLADHLALGCQQHLHLTQQFDNCFHKVHTLQPQQLREGLPPVRWSVCWLSHSKRILQSLWDEDRFSKTHTLCLNSWRKDSEVTIEGERKMRRVTQTVVGTKLALEALPFLFKRGGDSLGCSVLCARPSSESVPTPRAKWEVEVYNYCISPGHHCCLWCEIEAKTWNCLSALKNLHFTKQSKPEEALSFLLPWNSSKGL